MTVEQETKPTLEVFNLDKLRTILSEIIPEVENKTPEDLVKILLALPPDERGNLRPIISREFPRIRELIPRGYDNRAAEDFAVINLTPLQAQLAYIVQERETITPDTKGDLSGDQRFYVIPMATVRGGPSSDK